MYVVTFNQNNPTSDVSYLRQMSLADAEDLLTLAARIPKHGFIIDVESREIIAES